MAKLAKVAQNIFASTPGTDQVSKFGSLFAGSEVFTTDPATIQSLSNWLVGWFEAVIGGNAPTIQDMNAVFFVMTYQLAYLIQQGVAEWDAATTYYIGSVVNSAGVLYVSRTDTNTNHVVSDATNWKVIGGDIMSAVGDMTYGGVNGAVTRLAGNTTTTMQVLTQTGTGLAGQAPVLRDFKAPTQQIFTSGAAQTYTTPAGVMYIRIRMVGGGGGGAGNTGGSPGAASGNNSIWRDSTNVTTILLANGGSSVGNGSGTPANGGGFTINSPAYGTGIAGQSGSPGFDARSLVFTPGGLGGSTPFAGGGASSINAVGGAGVANSGGGGSGGGIAPAGGTSGSGGGGGGFIDAIISNPDATYTFTVAALALAGGGGSGGNAGGNGATGYIEVTEYYQ